MAKQAFDPDKIIDYKADYYGILGLKKGCLPEGATRADRQLTIEILNRAFRDAAKVAHRDHGGSDDAFKLVVRAHTILEDPILRRCFHAGGKEAAQISGIGSGFEVDWSKFGTYRTGTLADTIGYGLFEMICQVSEELNLTPAFHPTSEEHSYEWDWQINGADSKLALSITAEDDDVARLTDGNQISETLPFRIYLCIPRTGLYFLRTEKETVKVDNSEYTFNGKMLATSYSDFNLLETTLLSEAHDYISLEGKLRSDLEAFRSGELAEKQLAFDKEHEQSQFVNAEKMKDIDKNVLKSILRSGTFRTVCAAEGAETFLDSIPD